MPPKSPNAGGLRALLGIFKTDAVQGLSEMKDAARIRGTTPAIEQAARQLRQQLTPAEIKLWSVLRGRQLKGIKFRCQHPVGRFIVDFYCPAYKLVIEVDGNIHTQQADYDAARTEHLQSFGYRVLRFTNQMVMRELLQVLQQIEQVIETEFPPELGGGGGPDTTQLGHGRECI